jgi:hypothetical protein
VSICGLEAVHIQKDSDKPSGSGGVGPGSNGPHNLRNKCWGCYTQGRQKGSSLLRRGEETFWEAQKIRKGRECIWFWTDDNHCPWALCLMLDLLWAHGPMLKPWCASGKGPHA